MRQQLHLAEENNTPVPTVIMNIMRGHDQRRYNNRTRMDEVAAIFVAPDGTSLGTGPRASTTLH